MSTLTDKTCRETVWLTPPPVLDAIRGFFRGPIGLDPATEPSNPTDAEYYYTRVNDGLTIPWQGPVFVNPPYGKELMPWVIKITDEAKTVTPIVALLPGQRFETLVWQERLLPHPNLYAICFIRGRLKFLRPSGEVAKSNPYGSMLYIFDVNPHARNWEALAALGHILYPK